MFDAASKGNRESDSGGLLELWQSMRNYLMDAFQHMRSESFHLAASLVQVR